MAPGELVSAIFNEVLQFFMIWLGVLLIPILDLIQAGGWPGMVVWIHENFPQGDCTRAWRTLGSFAANPMGSHWTGGVIGLGRVMACGCLTTDFLVA